ncbi:MAG: SDR family NAD(P)-dependent oxidoreductase, partial [Reyranella sp.]
EAAPTMSAMARSFYAESRRVRNDKLKRELGVVLRYPSYREGLAAILATEG